MLYAQYDGSYLSVPGGRSRSGGGQYLGNTNQPTHINGLIAVDCSIIPVVTASAGETEYASGFKTAQMAEWSRTILASFGYPQGPTPLMGDNACATGLANNTVKIKRSKSIDMRFHWLRDRIQQGHFVAYWRKGCNNLADFFTKIIPVHEHQAQMKFLVRTPQIDARTRETVKRLAIRHSKNHGKKPAAGTAVRLT